MPILSSIILIPAVTAIIMGILPSSSKAFRPINLATTLLQLALCIWVLVHFDSSYEGVQFKEVYSWILLPLSNNSFIKLDYFIGVDGWNVFLLLLSGIVLFISSLASWEITTKTKGYFLLFQLLNASVFGTFLALDGMLFFIFFEFMLLPMYFLIGIWGGKKREYAAVKFFIYTLLGSILILAVIIIYSVISIDIVDGQFFHHVNLIQLKEAISNSSEVSLYGINVVELKNTLFILLLIGILIKLPSVPFHTWLPLAHVEAPTPISVILAGILLKIGAYGLLRLGILVIPDIAISYTLYFPYWE